MTRPVLAALAALMILSACGNFRTSSLNPFGWFSRSTEEASLITAAEARRVADNRALVAQVTEMAVEPMRGGAIVRAVGLPPTQGWWDAELVPENEFRPVDGVLSFRFVVAGPRPPARAGTPMSREVSAAIYVSDFKLANARQITVTGAGNARTSRR